jgi:hypothetical protein
MKPVREPVNILRQFRGVLTQVGERVVECRRRRGASSTQLVDLDREDTQHLADVVVQLTADSAALLFLRVNQPPGELLDSFFGEAPLRDFTLESLVALLELRGSFTHTSFELVTRPLKRVFCLPARSARPSSEDGEDGKDRKPRYLVQRRRERVQRLREKVLDGPRREHRRQQSGTGTAEPRGNHDRSEKHRARMEYRHSLQRDRQAGCRAADRHSVSEEPGSPPPGPVLLCVFAHF